MFIVNTKNIIVLMSNIFDNTILDKFNFGNLKEFFWESIDFISYIFGGIGKNK
jgi:hypothetical protein